MNLADDVYALLIEDCLDRGDRIDGRNATTRRIFGVMAEFDVTPLVSLRRTPWKNALREMEWFLSGSNNLDDLHSSVRHWWRPWASEDGTIWANYGQQLRRFPTRDGGEFDQIAYLLDGLENHPFGRRHVLTTWNPADMADSRTPITNCHNTATQVSIDVTGRLSVLTFQRSVDVIVGLPANWIQMAAFQLWLCSRLGRMPGYLKWVGGDVHVYEQHVPLAKRILEVRATRTTPVLTYQPTQDDFRADEFCLDGEYQPVIDEKAQMIV